MALTPDQIRQWILNKLDVSSEPNWADQNDVSLYRGLHIKRDDQLVQLKQMYKAKVPRLVQRYEENLTEIARHIKNFDIPTAELKEDFEGLKSKVLRLAEKWLATKREIEGREKGYFIRTPVGTTYYIDLDNGTDGPGGTVHDGLKEDNGGANYTAIAGTDATHIYIAKTTLDNNIDDDYNGDYLYNVTRGAGALITDYDAADNGNSVITHGNIANQVATDTFFIIRAWKTLAQYTTTTGRNAGDLAYVRANTDETMGADLVFDEDGDEDDYIEIRGCSSTDDPWGDASDVKPILSFGDAAFHIYGYNDDYWKINRLAVKESNQASYGCFSLVVCNSWYVLDCEMTDNSSVTGYGLFLRNYTQNILVENCIFKDNLYFGAYLNAGSSGKFIGCTFDGGAATTDYGLYGQQGSYAEAINCNFGQTTAHDVEDVSTDQGSIIKLRNCNLENTTPGATTWNSIVYEEDADATYGSHKTTYFHGTVTKDTGVTRVGGASSSAKMEPNTETGMNNPLTLNNDSLVDSAFKIWCAAAQTTITIYIRSLGVWAAYPTNTQLYCETSYLNHAVNATRSKQASTAVLSDETTWIAFSMTFTPLQAGFAYVNVYLKKFEAAKGCYVDIKPVIS